MDLEIPVTINDEEYRLYTISSEKSLKYIIIIAITINCEERK